MHHALRLALGVLLVAGSSARAAPIGQVKATQGIVTVTRASGTQAVQAGLLLEAGDTLTTQASSTVSLTLIDGTRFALGPRSVLLLVAFTWEATTRVGASVAQLAQGTAVLASGGIAAAGTAAMQLVTPRTRLAIGGTTLAVEVHP